MTPKQKKFCAEYLIDLNATKAAIRAGYSAKTAYSIGQRLLKDVEIQNRISNIRKTEYKKTIMTAEEVEYFLSQAARGELDEEVIITVGTGEGRSKAIKMRKQISDKERLKALELMGKRHRLFNSTDSKNDDEEVQIIDDTN